MGKKKLKITKKQIVVATGVILLLFAAAGAGFLLWFLQNKDVPKGPAALDKSKAPQMATGVEQAQSLAIAGKPDEAQKVIADALNKPGVSDTDKAQLITQQGLIYANQGDHQKALDTYLEAEKAKSGFTISHLIGEQYEALGNKAKAIEYFKKAVSQLDKTSIGYTSDKKYYEDKIIALGGQL
jgi:tetratricopeptide (TPR) repeat protein